MFRRVRDAKLPVLVTGGAGFIGSHLCERLAADGNHLICIDNLETGSLGNIARLMNGTSFEFREHDVIEPINIEVAQIYNLACAASPERYQADPLHTFKTCGGGSTLATRRVRYSDAGGHGAVHAEGTVSVADGTPGSLAGEASGD